MMSTFKNFFYQSIFQLTKILLPIITVPIVSNALGPNGLGTYNYTNSIAQYFVLIAGLGVGLYGNREIAVNRDNRKNLSKSFWELFIMSFIASIIALLFYFIIIPSDHNRVYFIIQSMIILAAMFDISWFFMGVEDFRLVSLSSIISQVISFGLIVLFVRDSSDLGLYIFIQGLNLLVSQLFMWLFVLKKINFVSFKELNILKHLKPSFTYFIPKVAILLYTNLNKTILGFMDSETAVGYYANTLILNSVIITLLSTIDTVLLPKFSNLASKGDKNYLVDTMKTSINIQLFFSIPAMFGIIMISSSLVPIFFGGKFLFIKKTIPLVAPLVVIIPLGTSISRQYLIPLNKIKEYNKTVIWGAIVSIITNVLLIPKIGIYGAIVGTLLAEFFVTFIRVYDFLKITNFRFDLAFILKSVMSSMCMFILGKALTHSMADSSMVLIIQVLIGIISYLLLMTLLKANILLKFLRNKI
ncbi:oligosaccharide flippase family protein [Vagococcus zengguangii]|uniref:Polysaccharide biosynthesis protein n=1 Tax=Vagococcus zengguangii TaxID=2571750 RepID=A0A4D7CUQ7_9ENTE|nr:oligosaccharide flippase family protein [Vagococcus zengguangii]QCI87004.1 polysaccharide biosynthesis protein [Vagococcus zengguangii]